MNGQPTFKIASTLEIYKTEFTASSSYWSREMQLLIKRNEMTWTKWYQILKVCHWRQKDKYRLWPEVNVQLLQNILPFSLNNLKCCFNLCCSFGVLFCTTTRFKKTRINQHLTKTALVDNATANLLPVKKKNKIRRAVWKVLISSIRLNLSHVTENNNDSNVLQLLISYVNPLQRIHFKTWYSLNEDKSHFCFTKIIKMSNVTQRCQLF